MGREDNDRELTDLVQRLRGVNWICHTYGKTEVLHDTVCHEAADAIEHLMGEIDFLDEHWRKNKKRIAELEAALNKWQKWWEMPWQDRRPDMADLCHIKARKVLGEKE